MTYHELLAFVLGVLAVVVIQNIPKDMKSIKQDVHDQKKLPEPWQVADEWNNTVMGDKQ